MLPGRFISAASIARFATEIEPEVPTTEPDVRRARVFVPVGASAAVMLIVPELVPPTPPILTTLAISRFSSAATKESLPPVSVPRSICRLSVNGLIVTAPELAETFALSAIVSAFSKISPELEVIDAVFEIDDPDRVNPPDALTAPAITIDEGLEISATVPVVETPQF